MSWMKNRKPAASPALVPPGQQIFNPNQQSYNQQPNAQWHQPEQQQQQSNWYSTNAQPNTYWQQQPLTQPMYEPPNQNLGPPLPSPQQQQQQQPPQYQNYSNPFSNAYNQNQNYQPQNHMPQNAYVNPQYQANNTNTVPAASANLQANSDPWSWGWGEENNSNNFVDATPQNPPVNNTVEDSFSNNDESWNWSVEDTAPNTIRLPNQRKSESPNAASAEDLEKDNLLFPKMGKLAQNHVLPLEDSLQSSGSRPKSENLTPQWSIESQVSQDSSDDVIQTSESDNHSHMVSQSQSSTVSQSPTLDVPASTSANRIKPDNYEKDITNKMVNISLKEANHQMVENSEILTSPTLVQNTALNQPSLNLPVNLETLPDNSEQPDNIAPVRLLKTAKHNAAPSQSFQNPDNYEIAPAPMNDRNQYLETGQLSEQSNIANECPDTLPPPGLRRMVLGQLNQTEENIPPPGLSRMVLGQTEASSSESPLRMNRMVPGESSSPEENVVSRRIRSFAYQETEDFVYESTVPERSATIGADTPPSIEPRETNLDGANTLDETTDVQINQDNRRDSIEGEPQAIVPQSNVADPGSAAAISQARVGGRKESSDSERETEKETERKIRKSPARYGKDGRQYYDRKERSPERTRDRKYDRKKYGDRYYEEESDYYSEREYNDRRYKGDRERREEDDPRKYRSLKKDKVRDKPPRKPRDERERERDYDRDKDRDYDRDRDYDKDRRRDYYYYSRYDDYREPPRSRPSSRSDSMHDYKDYMEAPSHDGRDRKGRSHHGSRRHRDNYTTPYAQGFGYDPYNQYYQQYQQYQYYENLRRTNPQAYAEMYRKYYQQQGSTQGNEERGSVHSGRSSANGEFGKTRLPDELDSSSITNQNDESIQASRLTPAKFATPHIKGAIKSGHLLKIMPHYPLDGQTATVEVINLQSYLLYDSEYKELADFPGPLVKGVTHKKTVIEYCENKIREAHTCHEFHDVDAYILMWELLILLLRQNGVVVGTDIAELLMKNASKEPSRAPSVSSSTHSLQTESLENRELLTSSSSNLKEDAITNKFREYLIYGSEKEALEWAMKHGLWGHALFLASKLDKRTYANVMTRFANGLPLNDPLQTLYQLLSGRQPAAVTSVADEKWGDWKPHLAMILSNTSQRPELDRKAITTLGDTLATRGNLYSAQFCYLMAQVGFSRYGTPGAKLVLLGSSVNNSFMHLATNDSIHMTEIYEYACSLNDAKFIIPEFQPYKYLIATRLADRGMLEKALAYLERVSLSIIQDPSIVTPSLIERVYNLSDRLKYYDIASNSEDYEGVDDWLQKLQYTMQNNHFGYQPQQVDMHNMTSTMGQEVPMLAPESLDTQQINNQESWDHQQTSISGDSMNIQQPFDYGQQNEQPSMMNPYSNDQPAYMPNQNQNWSYDGANNENYGSTEQHSLQDSYYPSDTSNQQSEKVDDEPSSNGMIQPQISMPNQSKKSAYEDDEHTSSSMVKNNQTEKTKTVASAKPAENKGWFGGLWGKLALRPKNQMKLPDDKNPTIVWDSDKNRWINLEDDNNESSAAVKPPPKMSEMFSSMQQQQQQQQPLPLQQQQQQPLMQQPSFHENNISQPQMPQQQQPMTYSNPMAAMKENVKPSAQPNSLGIEGQTAAKPPAVPNMFKMQRSRNIKQSYVDVFNPGGNKSTAAAPVNPMLNTDGFKSLPTQMNYFVPAPMNSNAPVDFLTPTSYPREEENAQT